MTRTLFTKGLLFLIALAVTLLFMHGEIRHRALSVFISIQKPFTAIGGFISGSAENFTQYMHSKKALEKENETLQEEIKNLSQEKIAIDDFKKDYAHLLETVRIAPREGIVARIVSTPSSQSFGLLAIDKGANEGITIGMKALLGDEILVGFVEEIFEHASRIRLLSSFNTETQLRLGEAESTVLATGKGGGTIGLTLPRDFPIHIGDHLLYIDKTPLIAGFIESIKDPGADATVEIEALIPFNPGDLSLVIIAP